MNANLRTPFRARPVAVYHHQRLLPRARLSIPSFPQLFVEALRAARPKVSFLLVGWIFMPAHFRLLFQPWLASGIANDAKLKQRSARAILEALRARLQIPECRAALRVFRLPPTEAAAASRLIRYPQTECCRMTAL